MIPVTTVAGPASDLLERIRAAWDRGEAVLPSPPDAASRAYADIAVAPDGTAVVIATSGTTGDPRFVALSHAAVESAVSVSLDRLGCQEGERWALALPTHHVAGLLVLLRSAALGTEAEIVPDPGDPASLAATRSEHIAIVPTQLVRCLRDGVDLGHLRTVLVGGGPLDLSTREAARSRGIHVIESYGATETCGGCVYDGVPLAGTTVDIEATGEILLSGPTLATSYIGDADATRLRFRGGWYRTGDRGRMGDGRLRVLGRIDDVAVSGGSNVPLASVTQALRSASGISDAVAIGVSDPEWGVAVRAVVVPESGTAPDLRAIRDHVCATLPRSHAPRELLVVASLPRDGLGKLPRSAVDALSAQPATQRLE